MIYKEGFKFLRPKDPDDVFDITCKFTGLLQGDTISTKTVTGERVTIDSSSLSDNTVTFFISGGADQTEAEIKIVIVTANATPRTFVRRLKLDIAKR